MGPKYIWKNDSTWFPLELSIVGKAACPSRRGWGGTWAGWASCTSTGWSGTLGKWGAEIDPTRRKGRQGCRRPALETGKDKRFKIICHVYANALPCQEELRQWTVRLRRVQAYAWGSSRLWALLSPRVPCLCPCVVRISSSIMKRLSNLNIL